MELKMIKEREDKTEKIFDTPDCQQLLVMYDDFYPQIGFHLPWVGYFIISDDKIVGFSGFVGQPQDGKVEISYWTFKEFEGQGFSSFGCRELLKIAYKAAPDVTVIAKTEPRNNASTKILEKNGFTFDKVVQDHEIGDAWLWIHTKN